MKKNSKYIDENLSRIFSTISKKDSRVPLKEISGSLNSERISKNTLSLDYSFSQFSNCKPFAMHDENGGSFDRLDSKEFLMTSLNPLITLYMALVNGVRKQKIEVFRNLKMIGLFENKEGMNATIIEEIEYTDDSNLKNFSAVLLQRVLHHNSTKLKLLVMKNLKVSLKFRIYNGMAMESKLMDFQRLIKGKVLSTIRIHSEKRRMWRIGVQRLFNVISRKVNTAFHEIQAFADKKGAFEILHKERNQEISVFQLIILIDRVIYASKMNSMNSITLHSIDDKYKKENQCKMRLQKACFETILTQQSTKPNSKIDYPFSNIVSLSNSEDLHDSSFINIQKKLSKMKNAEIEYTIEKYSKFLFSRVRYEDKDDDESVYKRLKEELKNMISEVFCEVSEGTCL